jgi:hypothetical protein
MGGYRSYKKIVGLGVAENWCKKRGRKKGVTLRPSFLWTWEISRPAECMPRYSQTYGQRHFACFMIFMSCSIFWVYHHILDSVGFSTGPEKPRFKKHLQEIHVSRSAEFSK